MVYTPTYGLIDKKYYIKKCKFITYHLSFLRITKKSVKVFWEIDFGHL